MNYVVLDHHNFWQREPGNSVFQDAEVVFFWADWPFADQVRALQAIGKKVVTWEHGFGAFADYTNNGRPRMSDGYLAIGKESAKCVGRSLVVGNPVYDKLKNKSKNKTGRALYVALHWVGDVTEYNRKTFNELKETYDEFEWDVKVSDKALIGDTDANVWYSGVEGVRSLPRIKNRLPKYDAIFVPKAGTLDSFARLMGVPVYVIDEHESWRAEGDPKSFKVKGDNYIEIGEKLKPRKIDMKNYIKTPSVSMDIILNWVKTL